MAIARYRWLQRRNPSSATHGFREGGSTSVCGLMDTSGLGEWAPTSQKAIVWCDLCLRKVKMGKPRTRKEVPKTESWYRMTTFFDNDAKTIMKVGEEDILLSGWVPPDGDLALCLAPTSLSHDQGLALTKLLEANLRKPVLLLTNNVQLVKLKPITDGEAETIMESDKGEILHYAKGGEEQTD